MTKSSRLSEGLTRLFIGTFLLLLSTALPAFSGQDVRPPAVAGAFYPGDPDQLRRDVERFLDEAERVDVGGRIIGLVTPHAGYRYSGPTAGWAFRQVAGRHFDVIVVIAPSHRDPFFGATIYPGDAYETPLGRVPIEKELAKRLVDECRDIKFSRLGHRGEHALEVELPFIQVLFPDVPIVPIVVGGYDWPTCQRIGETIAKVLKGREALIVASSDLYHGYSYEACRDVSGRTLEAVTRLDPRRLCEGLQSEKYAACGGGPIVVMEVAAKKLGAQKARLLARTNSGDVTGRKDGYVVGYGAVAVFVPERSHTSSHQEFEPLPIDAQKELLRMARKAIRDFLLDGKLPNFKPTREELKQKRGVFVTLTKHGRLRGCIGQHQGTEPLYKLVPQMALAAAFRDPRFPPLQASELDEVKIKISVYLTDVYKIHSLDEFQMGVHGIIMRKNGHAATYLPEVPLEAGWKTVEEEMESLCRKAGLPRDAWKEGAEFWVYKTQVFDESIL